MNKPQSAPPGMMEMLAHYAEIFYRRKWIIIPFFCLASVASFFLVQKSGRLVSNKSANVVMGIHQALQEYDSREFESVYMPKIELPKSRKFLRDVVNSLSLTFHLKNVARKSVFDTLKVEEVCFKGKYNFIVDKEKNTYNLEFSNQELGYDKKVIRSGKLSTLKIIRLSGFYAEFSPAYLENPFNLEFNVISVRRAVNTLLANFSIRGPSRRMPGHFIISLEGTDYPLITKTVNHIADYFIEQDILLRKQRTNETAFLLQKQLNTANQQRERSLRKLQGFLSENPDVALDQRLEQTVNDLVELEADQFNKINLFNEANKLLTSYKKADREDKIGITGEIITFLNAQNAITAPYLMEEFNTLIAQRNELHRNYAKNHPHIKINNEKIANVEDKAKNMLEKHIDNLKLTQKREKEHIKRLSIRANNLPKKYIRLAELERIHQIHSQSYSAILEKYNEAKLATSVEVADFFIMDYAVEPTSDSVLILLLKTIGIAMMLGLLISGGPVLAYEFVKRTASTPYDIKKHGNIMLLETLPDVPLFRKKKKTGILYQGIAEHDQSSAMEGALEAIRSLVAKLFMATYEVKSKSFAFIGLEPNAGKSTIAANTATAMAKENHSVLLIDGDMRKGSQASIFELPFIPGLSELLKSDRPMTADILKEMVQETRIPNLYVLCSGAYDSSSFELLSLKRMRELMTLASSIYDVIILDSPPMGVGADAVAVSNLISCYVAVALAGKTNIPALRNKIGEYPILDKKTAGLVLNKAPKNGETRYYRNYLKKVPNKVSTKKPTKHPGGFNELNQEKPDGKQTVINEKKSQSVIKKLENKRMIEEKCLAELEVQKKIAEEKIRKAAIELEQIIKEKSKRIHNFDKEIQQWEEKAQIQIALLEQKQHEEEEKLKKLELLREKEEEKTRAATTKLEQVKIEESQRLKNLDHEIQQREKRSQTQTALLEKKRREEEERLEKLELLREKEEEKTRAATTRLEQIKIEENQRLKNLDHEIQQREKRSQTQTALLEQKRREEVDRLKKLDLLRKKEEEKIKTVTTKFEQIIKEKSQGLNTIDREIKQREEKAKIQNALIEQKRKEEEGRFKKLELLRIKEEEKIKTATTRFEQIIKEKSKHLKTIDREIKQREERAKIQNALIQQKQKEEERRLKKLEFLRNKQEEITRSTTVKLAKINIAESEPLESFNLKIKQREENAKMQNAILEKNRNEEDKVERTTTELKQIAKEESERLNTGGREIQPPKEQKKQNDEDQFAEVELLKRLAEVEQQRKKEERKTPKADMLRKFKSLISR